MNKLEDEQIKFFAARAVVDHGMDQKKAYDLLKKDYEKAKKNPEKMNSFEKVIKKYF